MPEEFDEEYINDDDDEFGASNCRRCGGGGNGCSDCCPCLDEFDEVHCSLDDLCEKVCDIQESQEHQDACLGTIKATGNENNGLLLDLQTDVTLILEGVEELLLIGGGGAGGGGGGAGGNGDGCLVCINCGGSCCCDGEAGTCCCCDCEVEPPCDPNDPDCGPGGLPGEPDELCLITGDNGINDQDIIELWFSTKFKSCSRDYYLASSSFNWVTGGDFSCDQTGFHGIADEFLPGEEEVSQAAMYVKKNSNIEGLAEATTWMYDLTAVLAASDWLVINEGPEFEF
jgi:hypothetical protein